MHDYIKSYSSVSGTEICNQVKENYHSKRSKKSNIFLKKKLCSHKIKIDQTKKQIHIIPQ